MNFIVGILSFFLVIDCFLLILLVLVQLPKKDAGAGMAFGGGTADALFGAGSGNVLTKVTKYSTVALIGLAMLICFIQDKAHRSASSSTFEKQVQQKQMEKSSSSTPAATPTMSQQTPSAPAKAAPATPAAKSVNNLLSNLKPETNAASGK